MSTPTIQPVTITPEQQQEYVRRRAEFLDAEINLRAFLELLDAAIMHKVAVSEGWLFAMETLRTEHQQRAGKVLDIFDDAFGGPFTD